jgi:arsenate reductase
MAEGFARRAATPGVRVFSAGTAPVGIHERAVEVMGERGVDLSSHESKNLEAIPVDEMDLVVTLCGDAAERCAVLPGHARRLHWGLPDPAAATGSPEEILVRFREVRDEIERRVEALLSSFQAARLR